jgi:hypothetical protein
LFERNNVLMKGKIMKKMILTGTVVLALAGASLQSARAGEREWATVGQVLTGVAVAGLVVAASDNHAQCSVNYSYSAPAYCPPPAAPVVYCPAPPPPVVYCPPPAVVVQPSPVVYYPQPVVAYGAPVVVYPSRHFVHYEIRHGYW